MKHLRWVCKTADFSTVVSISRQHIQTTGSCFLLLIDVLLFEGINNTFLLLLFFFFTTEKIPQSIIAK